LDERELLDGPEYVPGLLQRRPAKRFAIVFGNEKNGLTAEELASCQVIAPAHAILIIL
jgi:tRNA C32,U32 (ribose-2'-O)-methylase TrmJ